ncbi:MAG: transcriptional regulator MarR family [Ilumatobacteraceae bacterium]|nr:transcriptional regulator MarR family [Ilumatobacteraceae bacterium]
MVVLTRRIENASRRSTFHRRMDRAAYLIARTLDTAGPSNVNEIARALSLDGSTVTRQVASMRARGFVERTVDPLDGRVWVISLTQVGRLEMDSVNAERRQRFSEYLAGWDPADIEQFGVLLERFNQSLESLKGPLLPDDTGPAPRSDHRRSVLPTRRQR